MAITYATEKFDRDAREMAKKVRLPYFEDEGVHNNAQDAFRHAYTSAVISRDWGILRAQEIKRRIDSGEVVVTLYDPRRMFEKHVDWELAKRAEFRSFDERLGKRA